MRHTTGFYGHLPKFWRCANYNDEDHENCSSFRWHMSYNGYVKFVGPKQTYVFWYMGNPYRHRLFERHRSRVAISSKLI